MITRIDHHLISGLRRALEQLDKLYADPSTALVDTENAATMKWMAAAEKALRECASGLNDAQQRYNRDTAGL